jgi:hypothetical protein
MRRTHASSKVLMASLMPSAPSASVPYGSFVEPDTLLSSLTRSLSSRRSANTRAIRPTAMILFLIALRRAATASSVLSTLVSVNEASGSSSSSSSSSFVQQLSTATSISVTGTLSANER